MLPDSVVVLVNADFEGRAPEADASGERAYEADAAVLDTADAIARTLGALGVRSELVRVRASLDGIAEELARRAPGVVFNLVESLGNDYGREWEAAAMLSGRGFRYTGNGPDALRLCRCKDEARGRLVAAGVRVAEAWVLGGPSEAPRVAGDVFPVFVKPARVDGSIGVDASSLCRTPAELVAKLKRLSESLPGPYLVERYLPGKELGMSIIPEPYQGSYVATEIDFSPVPAELPRFVTYDSKWNAESPEYASKSVPAQVSSALLRELRDQARRAFIALCGDGYGRVDFRLDAAGVPHVIDVNPNNDLHPDAGLARAAASVGLDYARLITRILEHAQAAERHVAIDSRVSYVAPGGHAG